MLKAQVYERGTELFTFPVSFEIWNIYLAKFVKRYVGRFTSTCRVAAKFHYQGGSKIERARDLFEQALEKCPAKSCKPIFMMYATFEEEYHSTVVSTRHYRAPEIILGMSNTSLARTGTSNTFW